MNCPRCRRRLQPADRWCSFCGTPAPAAEAPPAPAPHTPHQPTAPLPPPLPAQTPEATAPVEITPAPPPQVSQVVVQAPPASGSAIAALVFSLLGLVGPLFVIGPLLALAFGHRARGEILSSQGALGGWQLVRAARILAWTALVFLLLGLLAVAGLLAYGFLVTEQGFDLF